MVDESSKTISTSKGDGAHPDLITIGNPILRTQAKQVRDIQAIVPLCNRLVELLREIKGAGLAACQIDSSWSVFVVEVRKTELFPNRPESPLYVMINPLITEYSTTKISDWEGCFSVPDMVGQVDRAESVSVKYLDTEGSEHHQWFQGYIARVIQHECDHLAGKVYLDRMESMQSLTTVFNYRQFYRG
jgi:peptide deformylase